MRKLPTIPARLGQSLFLSVLAWAPLSGLAQDTIPVNERSTSSALPAEGDPATELDAIEVTGSRIKRTDFESAQPVLSISRADIERTGLTSIGDLLQELSTAGSALNTATNNGGNGSVEVDLRNLGSQRVLVLVNGRRWVNGLRANSSSSVDLNTIPISIIERVEVLKDGASAVYGSDAVAGVINIFTRKNYQGADLRSQFGQYRQGDGSTQSHSLSLGSVSGVTSTFVDVSYTLQDEVLAKDREIARLPTFGTGVTRGSSRTPQGRFLFVPNPATTNHPCAADGLCNLHLSEGEDGEQQADFRNFTNNDRYNFPPLNYLLTPNERSSIFSAVSHEFADWVTFQGEFLYTVRKSQQVLAETPIDVGDFASPPFNTLFVAADNPFNPFNQDIGRNIAAGVAGPEGDFGSGVIFRRLTELGPRIFSQNVDTQRLGGGFKGDFDLIDKFWQWDVGMAFAESRNQDQAQGLVNLDRLRIAVGPMVECETTPGCVPVNLFGGQGVEGGGSITPAMLNYIAYNGQGSQKQRQRHFYAFLSTELFNLPAGAVGAAYGLEYRNEFFTDNPDPLIQSSASSTNRSLPTRGAYDVREAYMEFNVPILADLFLADALDLTLAGRYSDYDVFGDDTNYKLGLRWKPYGDLLVRGTVSTAFRAPSVSDLYLGLSDSFPAVADACTDYTGANGGEPAPAEVQANCADPSNPANNGQPVPASYEQLNSQLLERQGGNPTLTPEEADTFTAGVVYNPSFLPDLNVYLDWYRIELTNAITTLGSQEIMDSCYRTPGGSSNCNLIERNSTGGIDEIRNVFLNIGALDVEGFEVTADYLLPFFRRFGNFKVQLDASYLSEYTEFVADASGALIAERLQGRNRGDNGFPRWKGNGSLVWSFDNWNAAWVTRAIYHQKELCNDGGAPSLRDLGLCSDPDNPSGPENKLGSVAYHDVLLGYTLPGWDLNLTGGIKNVFEKDPPVSFSAFANSYDVTAYEVPGMFPYIKLGKSF